MRAQPGPLEVLPALEALAAPVRPARASVRVGCWRQVVSSALQATAERGTLSRRLPAPWAQGEPPREDRLLAEVRVPWVAREGGTSGTDACANLSYDYCVSECLAEAVLVDNPTCANGAWSCRSGYVLASSCPPQACGVTPDACCDLTTGIVTSSPCMADGYRGKLYDTADSQYGKHSKLRRGGP
jgi:hypothetical protein